MSKNGRSFLLLVSSGILLLVILSVWTIRHCDKKNSFQLVDAVVCDEVSESFLPVGASDRFAYGTRQLCLWFEYRKASHNCEVSVEWYYRDALVFSQVICLSSLNGKRTLCLLREDGSPLPAGQYHVVLHLDGKDALDLAFNVTTDYVSSNRKEE